MSKEALWVVLACALALGACDKKDGAQQSSAGSAATPGSASAPAGSAAAAPTGSAAPAGSAAAAGAAAPAGSGSPAGIAPVPAGSAGSAAVAEGFKVGDTVFGMWTNGQWYPGKIGKINDDGTYRVNYNDGDVSPSLPLKKIKARTASKGGGRSSSGSTASGSEPCPASHWTRCGQNCTDTSVDRWNCGACGNSCPSNMSICRNGKCDCEIHVRDNNGGVCPP